MMSAFSSEMLRRETSMEGDTPETTADRRARLVFHFLSSIWLFPIFAAPATDLPPANPIVFFNENLCNLDQLTTLRHIHIPAEDRSPRAREPISL